MKFFKHFERVLRKKRQNDFNSEFASLEKLPRMKMRRTPLLKQAGQVYTPKMFESFQEEFDWSIAAYIKPGPSCNEYIVAISNSDDVLAAEMECTVFGDPITQTVACSCKLFERLEILCAHALKVIDTMNIKVIPEKYILKRWTKEARSGTVIDVSGRVVVEDPQLNSTRRYRSLCREFVSLASRAAIFEEYSIFLENILNIVIGEVDKMLSNLKLEESTTLVPDFNKVPSQRIPQFLVMLFLRKKTGRKGGRRFKCWSEKLHKKKRKNPIGEVEDQPATKNHSKKKKQGKRNLESQPVQEPNDIDDGYVPSFHPLENINFSSQDTNIGITDFDLMCLRDNSNIALGL